MEDERLIIHDEFITESGTKCDTQGAAIEDIVNRYISILSSIHSEAITSGAIADTLAAYITAAQKLGTQLSQISALAKTDLNTYISDVDTADSYVY